MRPFIQRLISVVMLIAGMVFTIYALGHPELSFPWSNAVTFTIYAIYIVVMVFLFIFTGQKGTDADGKAKYLVLIFAIYAVPYIYVAMLADQLKGTVLAYGAMILIMGVLTWILAQMRNFFILIAGNVLSYGTTCLCIYLFQTKEWAAYFKPFTPFVLATVVAVIMLALQIVFWRFARRV